MLFYFVVSSTEEITYGEIFFAIYFVAHFGYWFTTKIITRKEKESLNNIDHFLTLFIFLCVLSIIPAILFGNDLFLWIREFTVMSLLLLYFPIKDQVKTKTDVVIIASSFIILTLILALKDLINYKALILQATYFWQVGASRQVENEPLYLSMIIACIPFLFFTRNILFKLLISLLIILFITTLAITFSRGYWIALILGVLILFVLFKRQYKIHLLVYAILLIIILGLTFNLFFKDYSQIIITAVEQRFTMLQETYNDLSIQNRIQEYTSIIKAILTQPIIGHGLGSTFSFHDTLNNYQVERNFTHNSYLYLFFKFGILGLLAFMAFYISIIFQAWKNYNNNQWWLKALNISIFAIMMSLAIVSFSSPQIIQKNSVLIMTLCASFVEISRKIILKK
jgi:O-antigen ligase